LALPILAATFLGLTLAAVWLFGNVITITV
jgi:hypothetical protein